LFFKNLNGTAEILGENTMIHRIPLGSTFVLVFMLSGFVASAAAGQFDLLTKYSRFDPLLLKETLPVPANTNVYLVQLKGRISNEMRRQMISLGGDFLHYIPQYAFVMRMSPDAFKNVKALPYVRYADKLSTAFKVEREIWNNVTGHHEDPTQRPYTFQVARKNILPLLVQRIQSFGGRVLNPRGTGIIAQAVLTNAQLKKVVESDEVLWAERMLPSGYDMWDARIQGGADAIEMKSAPPGYTGAGITGHVIEGIYATHPDFGANKFRSTPIAVGDPAPDSHGQCTYGEIFGDGTGNSKARGMIPNAQGLYTNASAFSGGTASRYDLVMKLVKDYGVMFQTASWGGNRTTLYTAISAEMDRIIFDADIPITQSQSNAGTRDSRPQAWAKNIISVGALNHYGTPDPSDDKWVNTASIGPAQDGRIKPDISAYYDLILTTDGPNGYTTGFGGTSGATPMVAGHLGLALQMWTDGIFGNPLKIPGGTRFQNRPHAMTAKALMINSANQYEFAGASHDRTRVHQGWGFPSVLNLFENRNRMFVVDQSDPVVAGGVRKYAFVVDANQPELKVTMTYRDREGNPAAALARINNLDLRVTAPYGAVYWGNNGLLEANYSAPGGNANAIDTVENVFVKAPAAGTWIVEVLGSEINDDVLPKTPELDADFALVVTGIRK